MAPFSQTSEPPGNPARFTVLRRPVESAQYISIRYTERLAEAGMSRLSAASETATTTHSLRRSTVSTRPRSSTGRGPWRSFEAVEFATLSWVDWFNNRRLLAPIGHIPPAEAEERYYAMLQAPAMAA